MRYPLYRTCILDCNLFQLDREWLSVIIAREKHERLETATLISSCIPKNMR